MQGHIHPATPNFGFGINSGGTGVANAAGNSVQGAGVTIGNPSTDGVNGTPRTAAETRPRNMSLMAVIRYQ
jgi:hypothetical protein